MHPMERVAFSAKSVFREIPSWFRKHTDLASEIFWVLMGAAVCCRSDWIRVSSSDGPPPSNSCSHIDASTSTDLSYQKLESDLVVLPEQMWGEPHGPTLLVISCSYVQRLTLLLLLLLLRLRDYLERSQTPQWVSWLIRLWV